MRMARGVQKTPVREETLVGIGGLQKSVWVVSLHRVRAE